MAGDEDATPHPNRRAGARRPGAGGRGRHGHELAAGAGDLGSEAARLGARAERAEAELAEQRRLAARAIRGLQAEVTFWRLRAQGIPADAAATRAGLAHHPR